MEATAEGARSGMMTKRLPGISDSVRARENRREAQASLKAFAMFFAGRELRNRAWYIGERGNTAPYYNTIVI